MIESYKVQSAKANGASGLEQRRMLKAAMVSNSDRPELASYALNGTGSLPALNKV